MQFNGHNAKQDIQLFLWTTSAIQRLIGFWNGASATLEYDISGIDDNIYISSAFACYLYLSEALLYTLYMFYTHSLFLVPLLLKVSLLCWNKFKMLSFAMVIDSCCLWFLLFVLLKSS